MVSSNPAAAANAHATEVRWLDTDTLQFDGANPRLREEAADLDPGGREAQLRILEVLWRDFAVDEVALSIAENGYFPHEPLFVSEEDGDLVVIEGNRRLAAVKLLRDPSLRKQVGATDLPNVGRAAAGRLDQLPALVLARTEVWQYLGFKHVNGPQAWRSYSKAQYIAWVHNTLKVPLDEVASRIGDKNATVTRFYTALMALEQAKAAGQFDVEDRAKRHFSFSHLYTGLNYTGIQRFIGFDPAKRVTKTPRLYRHRTAYPVPEPRPADPR
jgi:ParB/Sulfiredoxin domain